MAGKYEMAVRRNVPDRIVMEVPGLLPEDGAVLATQAVHYARKNAPKLTGDSATRFQGVYGYGFFGVLWLDDYVWYQENGTNPFTMRSLAGKTIPMWIDDPTGTERAKNPRAKTKTTASGKVLVLIFRRAARIGQRKKVRRVQAGRIMTIDVPASYPGAPGRIGGREAGAPLTTPGKVAGRITAGNIGVRWRNPGISPRGFIEHAIRLAALESGIALGTIYPLRAA